MREVRITSTACHLPGQVLSNAELVERFTLEVDAEWIEAKTGIRSRHWMEPGETTSDMVVSAARRMLDERGLEARSIDRIILATVSPDYPSPSTATIVARKLGARCPAFDISAACAGFLYGLDLGVGAIRGGDERVLVLAADARSRFIDVADRRSVVLFADGAAGALLEPSDAPGIVATVLGAEGRERMGAHVPAGGALRPTTAETVAAGEHFLVVDGRREIFDLFVGYVREVSHAVLERAGLGWDDIDLFITHQGNARLVEEIALDLGLPEARVVNEIANHGNTSGATVPIALAEARASGRIGPGSTVMLASVGAGYTFGAVIHRF
jgi:3-oxoacyl-[acyl-carrier-protein] synthase-3